MIDCRKRNIDYIRISVTDRCNLKCIYCIPEEDITPISHDDILRYEEIERLCKIFAKFGISKIKITGGEPLVRKDIPDLISSLKKITGINNVTITTNGILLAKQINDLVEAGIDGINISLDSISNEVFRTITRKEGLDKVLEGLNMALSFDKLNIKLNCVPCAENKDELVEIAKLAKNSRLTVRFIELMPIGYGKNLTFLGEQHVKSQLEKKFGNLINYPENIGNGPAKYFTIPNFQGKIGFISAMSHKFCETCNRIRLTANGILKTCLQYESKIDLRSLLIGDNEIIQNTIEKAIFEKPECHQFITESNIKNIEKSTMSQIGG